MNITDLNPGDIIYLTKGARMISDLDGKYLYVDHIKINDSFPGVAIKWETSSGRIMNTVLHGPDIAIVTHRDENSRRWKWIANRQDIGDCWSLYDAPIAKNPRYQFMWQRWRSDGYYHCPFCDAKLNSVEDIEETFVEDIKECNCEGWEKQERKYNKYLKLVKQADKLKKDIIGEDIPPISHELLLKQENDNDKSELYN